MSARSVAANGAAGRGAGRPGAVLDEPAGRPGNIAGVARLAGVSVGTVSNVLNNPHLVAAATRARVEEVLRETGFIRNAAARQLTGALSSTVGCVLLDLSNPYFAEIARGIEDGLAEHGCLAIMCSSEVDTRREQHYLRLLLESRVRAVVLSPVEADPDALAVLAGKGTPAVLLDDPRQRTELCGVATDSVAGGRLAAEHLLDLGHRRIALLRHSLDIPSLGDRIAGVQQAVTARGLRPQDVLTEVFLQPPGHHGDPGPAVEAALAGPDPCTAFLAYNDMAALTLLTGLRDRGVSVPGDASVVGYDDLAFGRLLSPALTTIRQPAYDLGQAAARMVLAEAQPGHVHRQAMFTPALVVRESSGPPPSGRGRPAGS